MAMRTAVEPLPELIQQQPERIVGRCICIIINIIPSQEGWKGPPGPWHVLSVVTCSIVASVLVVSHKQKHMQDSYIRGCQSISRHDEASFALA